MGPSPDEELYTKTVLGLGFVTSTQIEEIVGIQAKIKDIGIDESLGDLLLKKGYLNLADHQQVLRRMGLAAISIPGYRILGKIGEGGMGKVYKAIQTAVDRPVALKVITQATTKDPVDVARFIHEAQAAGKLHHQNLVAAIDVGFSGGHYYFAMEFVVGKSCRELVKTRGAFPQSKVLDIAAQMVDALGYIHEHGLVHRDIKPENMLLTEDGTVKLCDFGLAKSRSEVDPGLTQEGFTVGTPLFMSPEQVRGDKDIDIRSDLYSLGASLFYLLIGKPPYEGKSIAETLSMHLKHPVPEAHKLSPQVSEDLSSLVHKLLAKERKDRYPSPKELNDDLDRIRHGSTPRHARQHAFQLQVSSKAKIPQRSQARMSRSPWTLAGVGLASVALVATLFAGAFILGGQAGAGGTARSSGAPGRSVGGPEVLPSRTVASSASGIVEQGKAEYDEAREIARLRPEDFGAQARALERAIKKGQGGAFAESARRDLTALNARLRKELASVEERSRTLVSKEKFKEALDLWTAVGRLHDVSTWTEAVSGKIEEIDRTVVERYAGVREKAQKALDRQDPGEIAALRTRLAGWGLATYQAEFESLMPPAADPESPLLPAETPAPREELGAGWMATMTLASKRDYAAAIRSLEGNPDGRPLPEVASDRENLLQAQAVAPEALAALSRMSKGQRVLLAYADSLGRPARIEGRIQATGPGRIELLREEGSVVIPQGEILPSTLAELFTGKAKESGAVRKAGVLFCLLEGDLEGARRIQGEPPPSIDPRYWEWAHRVSASSSVEDPREPEVRRLFYEAERLYFEPGGAVEAAAKYRQLLEKYALTSFVRRNEPALQARTSVRKDFVLGPGELLTRGGFKLVHGAGKGDAWVCQKDVDPAEMKDNFVQAEFAVLPELEYKCWVLAGGCCQEVLTFWAQGDEMTVPKPKSPKESLEAAIGTSTWASVKFVPPALKKKHADHGGPKQPDKWIWIPVPLPKYAAAGTKTLRLLTEQRGLAIAQVVVSTQRQAAPKDAELKDLERLRSEEPGYTAFRTGGGGPSGEIHREVWLGIRGIFVRDLTGNPNFPDRPSKIETLKAFDVPLEQVPDTGSRVRGYLHPPVTGEYVFWLAADDTGELWLSTDERPENKVLLASAPEWVSHHEWEKYPTQKSRPVSLRAGRRYYIEALEKQGGGGSHMAVGWQLPEGTQERPIPGKYLSPDLKK
jgi:serine/threonine protein kinase